MVIALLAIPGGLWAGWSLFGRRAGLICAALCAVNPFLTNYAQETRMYSLMLLLSLLTSAAFLHVFASADRSYLPAFVVFLALLVYTHNWGLFLAVGSFVALVPCWYVSEDRRALRARRAARLRRRGAALPALGAHAPAPDPAHRRALAQLAELRGARADLEGPPGRRHAHRRAACSPAAPGSRAILQRRVDDKERTAVVAGLARPAGHAGRGLARVAGLARLDHALPRRASSDRCCW